MLQKINTGTSFHITFALQITNAFLNHVFFMFVHNVQVECGNY